MENNLLTLPLAESLETTAVLKKLSSAHRYLAELKGIAETIPNETILIDTLALQEAKDSSEIENIITTHDDLYKEELFSEYLKNPAAKEVSYYIQAVKKGFTLIRKQRILTVSSILKIHQQLEHNRAGFRKLPGTALKNQATGRVVYTPPQEHDQIVNLMSNLVDYINDDSLCQFDPLVKMAIIHYQFESIHPFYDGNCRTGRIINILYLIIKDLQTLPILYLSRYITRNKAEYYKFLEDVRTSGNWESWILYILKGVEETSKQTIWVVKRIKELMQDYKNQIRAKHPKFYSQDLLNNLFRHPYTKIEYLQKDLGVSRITAMKYLNELSDSGLLQKNKIAKFNYYINQPLFDIFMNIPDESFL